MAEDRAAKAMEIRKKLGIYGPDGKAGGWRELNEIAPVHAQSIIDYTYGVCWNQPRLDLKTRELLVLAAAAAQDSAQEVELHSGGLLNQGVSPEELIEAIVQVAPYIGFPKANHALRAAKRAMDKKKASRS